MSTLHAISGCDNPARKADVMFIHGLGGDAFGTWRDGTDDANLWPRWLGEEFPDVGVWSLGYAASPSMWARLSKLFRKKSDRDAGYSMALPARAVDVLDAMQQEGIGQRPLFFICHSLGGLLAKQILRKAFDTTGPVAVNTRAVLFLATPHHGAVLASMLSAFRTILGTTVSIDELRAHDTHLSDLYEWYRQKAPQLGIVTHTYYETRSVKDVLPIVNPSSSHPGVGTTPVPLEEDHISISKPRDRRSRVCGSARGLLRDHVLAATPVALAPAQVIVHLNTPAQATPRIPLEIPPNAAGKFFGRELEKEKLMAPARPQKHRRGWPCWFG